MKRIVDATAGISLALLLFLAVVVTIPTSIWLDVKSVQVFDSTVGTSPRMLVDRAINRPFVAHWIVSVYRIDPNGFTSACIATGENDYEPTNRLPVDLNLDWWTWPTQCQLEAGEYVVRTVWRIDVLGLVQKETRVTSNSFRVAEEV